MDKCVAFVKAHRDAGTVYGADNKVTDEVIDGLIAGARRAADEAGIEAVVRETIG